MVLILYGFWYSKNVLYWFHFINLFHIYNFNNMLWYILKDIRVSYSLRFGDSCQKIIYYQIRILLYHWSIIGYWSAYHWSIDRAPSAKWNVKDPPLVCFWSSLAPIILSIFSLIFHLVVFHDLLLVFYVFTFLCPIIFVIKLSDFRVSFSAVLKIRTQIQIKID